MELEFKKATESDLPGIVKMLAEDELGAMREAVQEEMPEDYVNSFREIDADSNNELIVVSMNNEMVGTFQLSFIPYLTFKGGKRAQIEAVRVSEKYRGEGIGQDMFRWAIQRAKEKGCHLVQLTSNKKRPDALRFYESLGFEATHEGMKLYLKPW